MLAPARTRSASARTLGVALSLLLCGQVMLRSAEAATAPIPQVKPIPDDGNLPLNSAMFAGSRDYGNFAVVGYVEEEFYISGKASTRDQESGAVLKAVLPYTSRIIVRRPVNPKKFSGNVIVEPLHGVLEKSEMWEQTHDYMTRHGDIWVGVTVKAYGIDMEPTQSYQLGGIPLLKAYDAERYGPLNLEPDMRPLQPAPPAPTPPQALDLVMQVGALVKSNGPESPLKGFDVKRAFLVGGGINGEITANFVRTHMDEQWRLADGNKIYDGYFAAVISRLMVTAPKGAAFAMFHSENEAERAANLGFLDKNLDTPSYKVYDVPGSAHLGSRNSTPSSEVQAAAVLPKPELNMPYANDIFGCPNVNDDPIDLFMSAILSRVELWAENGTPLPAAPRPETIPGDPGASMGNPTGAGFGPRVATLKRDPVSGNVIGGVRLPWLEAPIALYKVPERPSAPPGAGGPPGGGGPAGANGAAAKSGSAPSAPGEPPPYVDIIHGIMPGSVMPAASTEIAIPTDAWARPSKDKIKNTRGRPPFCLLFTPRKPYDKATMHKLYSSYDDYLAKFERAKENAVKAGWLLKEDAKTLNPRGKPSDFS